MTIWQEDGQGGVNAAGKVLDAVQKSTTAAEKATDLVDDEVENQTGRPIRNMIEIVTVDHPHPRIVRQ